MCTWEGSRISRATATRPRSITRQPWPWMEPRPLRAARLRTEFRKVLRSSTIEEFFMRRLLTISTLALAMVIPALLAQKQPAPKSKGEVEALQALFGAVDP